MLLDDWTTVPALFSVMQFGFKDILSIQTTVVTNNKHGRYSGSEVTHRNPAADNGDGPWNSVTLGNVARLSGNN